MKQIFKKLISAFMIFALVFLTACTAPTLQEDCTKGHVDGNNDGFCDRCYDYVVVVVDFYAINDLHGKFDDTAQNEGVDELTTFLYDRNTRDDHTVFLASGDIWQGSAESNITRGELLTKWMNEIGVEAMALGNHEFDWGEEYIEKNSELAAFPFLAINVFDKETNERVEYCDASVMIERGGIKIGIIGAIGDCYSSISSDKVEDVYFKTGSALTELVKAESLKLRSQGAEYIVYSLHDGHDESTYGEEKIGANDLSSYYDIALSDGYVDLVFEGHTHKKYVLKDRYGVYHMQNGGENRGISHVEVAINPVSDTSVVKNAKVVENSEYTQYDDHPLVDELLDLYKELIVWANREVGYNKSYRDSDTIGETVAMLYAEKGEEKWGEEYDIVLGGGLLQTRSPYNLYSGNVRYSDLMSILPFDNPIVLCAVQGSKLRDQFLNNSRYKIHLTAYGEYIEDSIEYNKTYYIIVDSYTAFYKYNGLTIVDVYDENTFARDLLAEHIERGGYN